MDGLRLPGAVYPPSKALKRSLRVSFAIVGEIALLVLALSRTVSEPVTEDQDYLA